MRWNRFFMRSAGAETMEKSLRILLVLVYLLTLFQPLTVMAGEIIVFAGYENENFNPDLFSGSVNTAVIDLTSISGAVDLDGLAIDFSIDAFIEEEAAEELDDASVEIGFGSGSTSPDTTTTISRGQANPGTSITLISNAAIPSGTRYLFFELIPVINGATDTASFSSPSLIIHDEQNPSIVYVTSPSSWTNGSVQVTITASDAESGIEGIYDESSIQVSDSSEYSFATSSNGTWIYTARDNSGNVSDPLTVSVDFVDTEAPAAPVIAFSPEGDWSTAWSPDPLTVTLSAETAGAGEAPVSLQYAINSGSWQDYSSPFTLSTQGENTVEARAVDAAGNQSGPVSTTAQIDTSGPDISTSSTAHPQPQGGAEVTASATDTYNPVSLMKYAPGDQDVSFFSTGGTEITGGSFEVSSGGTYTVYAEDSIGNASTGTLHVNTYPVITSIVDQTISEDGSLIGLSTTASDGEDAAADLMVTASSGDTGLLPHPAVSYDAGIVLLDLAPLANRNGSAVVTLSAEDTAGLVTTSTFTVTVTPVNDDPTAVADSETTDEDTPVTIDVLANDNDTDLAIEGDTLTVTGVTEPEHGTASIVSNQVLYTPDADYNGSDSFSYTMQDAAGTSPSTASVSVTINAVNDAPVAVEDTASTNEDDTVGILINVLANDTDTESDTLYLVSITQPSHGSAAIEDGQVRYIPDADWNGSDTFTYTVADRDPVGEPDPEAGSDTGNVSVTVTPVNDDPTAVNDSTTTDEDTPIAIDVLANDTDVDLDMEGDVHTITGVTEPEHGTASIVSNQVLYTPDADYNGSDSFSYTMQDAAGTSPSTASVSVTINAVNDAPVAVEDTASTNEDDTVGILINVLANDTDTESDTLYLVSITQPSHGSAAIETGQVRYIPDADWNGEDTFTYVVADRETDGLTDTGTVTVTVMHINDDPVAVDDTAATDEDFPVVINVLANDTDEDIALNGDELIISAVTGVEHATVTIAGDGKSLTFEPDPDWNGIEVFNYTVRDTAGAEDTGMVTVTVSAVNDAPVAAADSVSTLEDTPVTINVLANDSDVDLSHEGDNLTIVSTAGVENGSVSIAGDFKSLTFTPGPDWNGVEEFSYTMQDSAGATSSAAVTVTVQAVNDAPVISAIEDQAIDEDSSASPLGFTVSDVETDPSEITVTTSSSDTTIVPFANITLTGEGTADLTVSISPALNQHTWDHDAGADAPVTIAITASDGELSSTETFTVTVNPVNDAPVAGDDSGETAEDTPLAIDVLANDSDVDSALDGDTLIIRSVGIPGHGTASIQEGQVLYTPAQDWNGEDTFTYVVADREADGLTDTGTVTVTVTAVNDAPNAVNDSITTDEDTPVTVYVLANDTDVDLTYEGDDLTIVSTAGVDNGTVSIAGDSKSLLFTPDADWNGTESFTYTIRDEAGITSSASVTVTVSPVNDPLTTVDDAVTLAEDAVTTIDVLANDTDIDLSTNPAIENLTITAVTEPSHGTASIVSNEISYTPDQNYYGTDTFEYTATDAGLAESTATVSLTITPVNDHPAFSGLNSSYTVDEDNPITVEFSISDPETPTESLMLQASSSDTTMVLDSRLVFSGLNDSDPITYLTITPTANKHGSLTINLSLGDGFLVTSGSFTLNITSVNDVPDAVNDNYTFTEDNSLEIDMDDLVSNDTDIDGDTLSFVSFDDSSLTGTLTLLDEVDRTYRYDPPTNFDGTTTFTYTVTDGTASDTGTVTLRANAVNDAPVITMDPGNPDTANEDQDLVLAFSISDPETPASSLIVKAGSSNTNLVSPDGLTIYCEDGSCTLTVSPEPDQNGTVAITVSVNDGLILVPEEVNLTFNAVQDAPTAVNDSYTVEKNSITTITPMNNDFDVDDTDSITIVSYDDTGLLGSLANNGDGSFTYTAPNLSSGTDTFTYTITDGTATATATVTFTLSSQNDGPALTNISDQFISEDTSTAALAFKATDPEGDALTISASSSNTDLVPDDLDNNLVIADLGSGNYTITVTPAANAFGSAVITVTASDGSLSTTNTFNLTVYPVNDAPVAVDDSYIVDEDNALVFDPTTNDSDLESMSLTVVDISAPSHGQLTVSGSTYTYTPFANYNGSETLTYSVTDGEAIDTATITITINPVNDSPDANPDNVSLEENIIGESAVIAVLANDGHGVDSAEGETLSVDSIASNPSHGTAVINPDGTITYTRTSAPADARDTFVYMIRDRETDDPDVEYATATVTIDDSWGTSISAHNAYATVNEDAAEFDISLSISDGFDGGWTLELLDEPTLGSASYTDINGAVVAYTPSEDVNGSEILQYKVTSRAVGHEGQSATANISITILPVNDIPTITPVADQTIEEDTSTGALTATIGDVETAVDDLTFEVFSGNEDLVLDQDISITYNGSGEYSFSITPIPNRHGTAEITLLASDGIAYGTETFTLTVNSVNDIPVAPDYSATLNEDSTKNISVVAPDADVDGDALILTIITEPVHGTAVIETDQTITYTPAANYNGPDSFEYQLDDGSPGGTASGTVSITVLPLNDAPNLFNLTYLNETPEDTPAEVTFTVSDIDTDYPDLVFSFASSNTALIPVPNIALSGAEGAKTLTITPTANNHGEAIITVTVSDGSLYDQGEFRLVVDSVNDLPTAGDDFASTDEDTPITINVTQNDSDVEDETLHVASVTDPAHGSVTNNLDGTIRYVPSAHWYGTDTFDYTVLDNNNGTANATVTVTVASVNDAPTARTDNISTVEDTPVDITPLSNDSDIENDTISLVSVGAPSMGTIEDLGEGVLRYTPELDAYGLDTFSYTITDGNLQSTGSIRVSITAVNDAPRLSSSEAEPWTLDEDTTGSFPINIYDPETLPENLVIQITSSDQGILPDTSIYLSGSGQDKTLTLDPELNAYGSLVLTINATDGVLTTIETFNVVVNSVNDAPTITNIVNQTMDEDSTLSIAFTVSDVENPGAILTVSAASTDETLLPLDGVVITGGTGGARTVTITPEANHNGSALITLTVGDADGATGSDTFQVTVNPVNDDPFAGADTASTAEDTAVTIDVLANDSDIDFDHEGDSLTVVSTAQVDNGSVTIALDGKSLTFDPDPDWNGTEEFTYTIQDEHSAQDSATVTVTVSAVNDAPIAVDDNASTPEDTAITVNVLANDTDVDLDTNPGDESLTVTDVSEPGHGSAVIQANQIVYTPAQDYYGSDTFTYTVRDEGGLEDTATVTVEVTAVNDPPVISAVENQTISEDSSTGALSFTVTDVDNDDSTLDIAAVSSDTDTIALSGIVIISGGGSSRTVTVTPGEHQNTLNPDTSSHEPVTLTLTVTDGELTDSTSFEVTITPVNDGPLAVDDTVTTDEDSPITVSVLANDSDPDLDQDGDNLLITATSGVDNGSVTVSGDSKTITFNPNQDWNGTEIFTYTIGDKAGVEASASVTITVNPVNDPPAAVDDTASTNEDVDISIDVLDNDTDVDLSREGDDLTITGTSGVDHGTVIIAGDSKSLSFSPDPDWNGIEEFTYTIQDESGVESSAVVSVTVMAVNDPPAAADDAVTTPEDTAVNITPLNNDSDVDLANEGDDLVIISTSGVENGSVQIAVDGKSLAFTPDANWNGVTTFSYTIEDQGEIQANAFITVTVTPVNDAPAAVNDTALTDEDVPVTITPLENDTDVEGDALTITGTSGLSHGSAAIAADGQSLTFTPDAHWNGSEQFTYTIQDTSGAEGSAVITVTVNAVSDPPSAAPDTAATEEDIDIGIDVLANDSDPDLLMEGDDLTIHSATEPANGTVTIAMDGKSLVYAPDPDWNGTDTFDCTIQDQDGTQSTASVTVTVSPVNDGPAAVGDTVSTPEDQPVTVYVLANDTDPDLSREGDTLIIQDAGDPVGGTVEIAADSLSLAFTPDQDWNGTTQFTYTAADAAGLTSEALVTVAVSQVNDAPLAVDDELIVVVEKSRTINVLQNDLDADLDPERNGGGVDQLAVVTFTAPAYGSVIVNDDDTLTYTAAADYLGTDNFTYTIRDSAGLTSLAVVYVQVLENTNDAPEAVNDQAITREDTQVKINVIENDIDPDLQDEGDQLLIVSISGVEHGKVAVSADGTSLTFTPDPDWNGTETFSYTIEDKGGLQSTAEVQVVVSPVNDPPTISKIANQTIMEDATAGPIQFTISDVDDDISGLALSVESSSTVITPQTALIFGRISPGTRTLTITPTTNQNTWSPAVSTDAPITVTVTVSDGELQDSTTFLLSITPVNDAPRAVADAVTMREDEIGEFDVLANDLDPDIGIEGGRISIVSVEYEGSADVSVAGQNRIIRFVPQPDWNGLDVFRYTIEDEEGMRSSVDVTVTVLPVNDAPQAVDDLITLDIGAPVTLTVLDNDSDIDFNPTLNHPVSEAWHISSVTQPENGQTSIEEEGQTILYRPSAGWSGTDVFTYTVMDAGGLQASARVKVSVLQPLSLNGANIIEEETEQDQPLTIDLLLRDVNLEYGSEQGIVALEGASITRIGDPQHGSVELAPDGSIRYTPVPGFVGLDVFIVELTLENGETVTVTVNVTVGKKGLASAVPVEQGKDEAQQFLHSIFSSVNFGVLAAVAGGLLGAGGLILILALNLLTIRVGYETESGSGKKAKPNHYRRVRILDNHTMKATIDPPAGAPGIVIKISRLMTRFSRGSSLLIHRDGNLISTIEIPGDAKGPFIREIPLSER